MKSGSPLGRYAAIVAAIVVIGSITAAIASHLIAQAVGGSPDNFLDLIGFGAFTAVLGTAGSLTMLNGTVARTSAQDVELAELRRQVAALQPPAPPAPPAA